ncbi:MAG: hypothetical protein JWQ14_1219, partial [Adhaeribacter sp.]|nr:hypothetical protein [Adhaeribacter sp.]
MVHVCMIPGLGVDERIFKRLAIIENFSQNIIRWLP